MKICILARALPCHLHGGLEYHTVTLAKTLAQNGNSVTILTTSHEHNQPCPEKYDNIEVIHLPDTKPAQYNFTYFKNTLGHVNANP